MLPSSPPSRTHIGQIMTRSGVPTLSDGTNKYFLSRSNHYCRSATASFRIEVSNFIAGVGDNAPAGAASTVTASYIESPAGVFTAVTWGGAPAGTSPNCDVPDGGRLLSDPISRSVGPGALVAVWLVMHNPNFSLLGCLTSNTVLGDIIYLSSSPISYTPGDSFTSNTSALNQYAPCAIIAETTKPSFIITGDSIFRTGGDTADLSGDIGYGPRSIGPNFGYILMAISGTRAADFTATNSPRRTALANDYGTHLLTNLSVNDFLTDSVSAATMQSRAQTHLAAFPNLQKYYCLTTPLSDSTNGYTDTAHQSVKPAAAGRVTWNDYLRGGPSPLAGYFDPNSVVESSLNSGLWVQNKTTDGIHMIAATTAQVVAANVIPPSSFAWP